MYNYILIIIYKCSAWTCPFFHLCCPTPSQPCPTPTLLSCQSPGASQTIWFINALREGFFKPFLTARSLNDLPSLSTSTTRKRLKDAGRSSTCDDPTVSTTRAKLSIHQVLWHLLTSHILHSFLKSWGQSAKLGKHSAIWGKLGTALQAYTLNPCTKFPPNPTSRKVNT